MTLYRQPDYFDRHEPFGTRLNNLVRSDRHLTWLHLALLFPVTIRPFTTRLFTEFLTYRTALLAYWFNILLLGGLPYCCWIRTTKARVVRAKNGTTISTFCLVPPPSMR